MNVGLFSDLYRPDVNGTVTSVVTFEEELERAGLAVKVFAPTPEPSHERRREGRNADGRAHRFRAASYPWYPGFRVSFPLYRPVREELDRLDLDVVHSHTPFSLGIFATRVARKRRIPHVHTYHTRWPFYARYYMPGAASERWMREATTYFCNLATRIIAPSESTRETLRADGVRTPIDIVATPVASDAFGALPADVRQRHGIASGAPLLVSVSRLGFEKSIDFMLRAFARVQAAVPEAHLLLAGDGPARAELEELAERLGVAGAVRFVGRVVDRADVFSLYAAADVCVYASRTETQCLTLLEAAAVGLPLVARRDAPLEAALVDGFNGVFVDGDEREFAQAVLELLRDPERRQTMARASIGIAERQDAASRARDLIAVYERAGA
jgi:glycosyltransferase involved in cell wall biosynthesis